MGLASGCLPVWFQSLLLNTLSFSAMGLTRVNTGESHTGKGISGSVSSSHRAPRQAQLEALRKQTLRPFMPLLFSSVFKDTVPGLSGF